MRADVDVTRSPPGPAFRWPTRGPGCATLADDRRGRGSHSWRTTRSIEARSEGVGCRAPGAWGIARRRGNGTAMVAVGNSMLTIIWHLLSDPAAFQNLGADCYEARSTPNARINPEHRARNPAAALEAVTGQKSSSTTPRPSSSRPRQPDPYLAKNPAPLRYGRYRPPTGYIFW